jgi:hypothetical protein
MMSHTRIKGLVLKQKGEEERPQDMRTGLTPHALSAASLSWHYCCLCLFITLSLCLARPSVCDQLTSGAERAI